MYFQSNDGDRKCIKIAKTVLKIIEPVREVQVFKELEKLKGPPWVAISVKASQKRGVGDGPRWGWGSIHRNNLSKDMTLGKYWQYPEVTHGPFWLECRERAGSYWESGVKFPCRQILKGLKCQSEKFEYKSHFKKYVFTCFLIIRVIHFHHVKRRQFLIITFQAERWVKQSYGNKIITHQWCIDNFWVEGVAE